MKEYKTFELTDKETGEVISTTKAEIKPGTQVGIKATTEEQRDSYKHKLELNKEIKAFIEENEGVFVHLMFKYGAPIFKELEEKAPGSKCNTHVIRFMMLTTCLTFGGKLFDSNKNEVKKSSLKKIWDTTSKNSIYETYNLLKECGYIYETEEGYIMINEDLVIKGAIENFEELRKQDHSFTYTRVFIDNLRDMYYNTEPKQRKQLANLFKALPYIHYKYNIFCSNPTESDAEKVKPLNWTDLARLCGYDDKKQVARFKKDLTSLGIFDHSVIGQFDNKAGKIIVVNPKVYYAGDDVNEVKNLQQLFDWADGKK